MSLAERIFRSRESVVEIDPDAPLRAALGGAVEIKRLLVEHLAGRSAFALLAQENAAAQNNPLAVAFAAGMLKALTDVIALAGDAPKEK